jgi:hypothetical protein
MILVQHNGDFAVLRLQHGTDVEPNTGTETLFGVGEGEHGLLHLIFGDLHGVLHDVEEDLVFALKVVIESALAELEGGGEIIHGSGIVAALAKQLGGSVENVVTGVGGDPMHARK